MPTGWFEKKETTDTPKAKTSTAKTPGPSAAAKPVKVPQLLSETTILIAQGAKDKDTVLESLVGLACRKAGLADANIIMAKVRDRERDGISTTLDTGLSLPHVRLDGLSDFAAAMAVLPAGLTDPKQPDLTIRVMFLFFSPNKPEFFPQHLQLLRGVSSLFQPALIDKLVLAATPAAAFELIGKTGA